MSQEVGTLEPDLDQMLDQEFWRTRAPEFHIGDIAWCNSFPPFTPPPEHSEGIEALLWLEGHVQVTGVNWGVNLASMVKVVRGLTAQKLLPVLAFIYDEFWIPFFRLHHIFSGLLGGSYCVLPDLWIWDVDPRAGDSGWRPHRDKGRGRSLMPDRTPKALTSWIPLSRATTLNGCMYVVPAHLDPRYGKAEPGAPHVELPSVRALPAEPGDFLIWTQELLHWGSRSSPRASESRVSMAVEFQRADTPPFNEPLLQPLTVYPFEARLHLIAQQILQYKHMYALQPELAQFAKEIVARPATG